MALHVVYCQRRREGRLTYCPTTHRAMNCFTGLRRLRIHSKSLPFTLHARVVGLGAARICRLTRPYWTSSWHVIPPKTAREFRSTSLNRKRQQTRPVPHYLRPTVALAPVLRRGFRPQPQYLW